MGITTSDSAPAPGFNANLRSKQRCWVCNGYDKVFALHPAYGYRVCRKCVSKEGIKPSLVEPVEEESGASEA
jgi:hypothetical protein